jgi:hypothetical protein
LRRSSTSFCSSPFVLDSWLNSSTKIFTYTLHFKNQY